MIDVLMRRRQNNPILTGEAGVGQDRGGGGLRAAHRHRATCRRCCARCQLRALDVGLLQAGASMKGEFENRLRQVIEEVQSSPKPIILFIDEAHTLIGAGGAAGTGDAANLLKPALARGTLRTIAATTWAEYKKYIEKDPALTRRFQVVQVEEPGEEKAILMMRGIASPLEKHHQVQILDEAIEAAVRLSHRYIPARQLPDKSVSLLDTAAARVAISQHAAPPAVEDCRAPHRGAGDGARDHRPRERDRHRRRRARGLGARARSAREQDAARRRWKRAGTARRRWSDQVLGAARAAARGRRRTGRRAAAMLGRADARCRTSSPRMQGETPLILPSVDEQAVAAVVGDWTGIPVGRMVKNEIAGGPQAGRHAGRGA